MATHSLRLLTITLSFIVASCGGGGSAAPSDASTSPAPVSTADTSSAQSPSPAPTPANVSAPPPASTPAPSAAPAPAPSPAFPTAPADATQARFDGPQGIARSVNGDLYVADTRNRTIRKIAQDGTVTTLAGTPGVTGSADGIGASALFTEPKGIAVDTTGNVYVTDGSVVRKITPSRVVTTLAGKQGEYGGINGAGAAARFYDPEGIAVDSAGNLFVADPGYAALNIRKITPAGTVGTWAGGSTEPPQPDHDGLGAQASFIGPTSIVIDGADNLYLTDIGAGGLTASNLYSGSTLIRKIAPDAAVTTLAGTFGFTDEPNDGNVAQFSAANGIAVDGAGNIFVLDHFNNGNRILKLAPGGSVSALPVDESQFGHLSGLTIDADGNLYAGDDGKNTIYKITQAGSVTAYAGKSGEAGSTDTP